MYRKMLWRLTDCLSLFPLFSEFSETLLLLYRETYIRKCPFRGLAATPTILTGFFVGFLSLSGGIPGQC